MGDGASSVAGKNGDPRFYELLNDLANLHERKNTDYAEGGKQGPLGNFTRVSTIKRLYPNFDWASAFGTAIDYALKQLDAAMILYSTKRESITGEPIPARMMDVAAYSLLSILLLDSDKYKLKESATISVCKPIESYFERV